MTTQPTPTVKTLITSVRSLAKYLNLSDNAIYRWIKVNRIPGTHVIKVANFYNLEITDLLPLTGSDKSASPQVKIKSRDALPTLMKVEDGTLTIDQAADMLDMTTTAVKLVLTHWSGNLKKLYDTFQEVELGLLSIEQAALRLGVAKYTFHNLRRKYGFAPGPLKSTKPRVSTTKEKRARNRAAALDVIAGRKSAREAAKDTNVSERTLFRTLGGLTPHSVMELSHWPESFRLALVEEITREIGPYCAKWLELAEGMRLFIRKRISYPKTPEDWKRVPLKRMMVGILLGEVTLEEVAAARGGEPSVISVLFSGDLKAFEIDWPTLMSLSMQHQIAFAEMLLWHLDRKRKWA